MIIQYILVGLGGSLGAILRFVVEACVNSLISKSIFPFGTLIVNLLGCLVIGFLFGVIVVSGRIGPRARLLFITGFLGALTTFSSFGYETFELITRHEITTALLSVLVQVLVGIFAVWAGYVFSRLLAKVIYI